MKVGDLVIHTEVLSKAKKSLLASPYGVPYVHYRWDDQFPLQRPYVIRSVLSVIVNKVVITTTSNYYSQTMLYPYSYTPPLAEALVNAKSPTIVRHS